MNDSYICICMAYKMSSVVLQIPYALDVREPKIVPIAGGIQGKTISITPVTNPSPTRLAFDSNPNPTFVLDKNVIIKYTIEVEVTTTGGLPDPAKIGFRSFPLNRASTNANLQIGNTSFSSNPAQNIDLLLDYNDAYSEMYTLASGCPSAKDMRQTYDESGSRSEFICRNELQDGFVNHGRNMLPTISYHLKSGNTYIVRATFWEPIFVGPLLQFNDRRAGFFNINRFNLDISLSGLTKDIFCCMPNSGYTINPNYNITAAEMRSIWYAPTNGLVDNNRINLFESTSITRYENQTGKLLNPGEEYTAPTQINNLSSGIPNYIGIYVAEHPSSMTVESTNTFLTIKQMSVSFGTNSSNLATFDEFDLWKMSRENGYTGPFQQFLSDQSIGPLGLPGPTGRGSVILLKPGKDIFSADQADIAGTGKTLNFQATVTFRNGSSKQIQNATVYMFTVYFEKCEQDPTGNITRKTSYIDNNMITQAYMQYGQNPENVTIHNIDNIQGGMSFGEVFQNMKKYWQAGKPLMEAVKGVKDVIAPTLSTVPGIGTVASIANTGLDTGYRIGDAILGQGKRGLRKL